MGDLMATMINVNGTLTKGEQAVVPVLDHGFLYGEGVYEVCRTYNGRLFLYDRHMRRLRRSAEMIGLDVPFTDEDVAGRIEGTLAAAGLARPGSPAPEAYVRILVTRGVGDLTYDPDACPQPSLVIIAKPHVAPTPDVFDLGVRVALVPIARNHPDTINPLIKSNNLLNNALAMQHALRQGAFEAVMRNLRGEISECSQSNLFIVRGGTVLTPPLSAGLLAGITREFVFEIAGAIGAPAAEATLRDRDLLDADEAFLTSTTREVVPIVLVDEHRIGTGHPGPVTRALLDAFRARADALTRGTDAQTPAFSA
jgi:branched-chain amino acid aminotransferase